MAQLNTPIDAAPRSTTAARIGWTVLILATLYVCYFSHLGAIGFVGPDEPRYAWIARDMAESGDWVTPRLYGKPWFEKPVLYYWGAAFFFKLAGVSQSPTPSPSLSMQPSPQAASSSTALTAEPSPRFSAEIAARLPSAISALLATLALAWLALRIYGPETARWFLLLLPTTVGMIGFSHAAATDMPFSAMLTIAMVFAAVLLGIVPAGGISVHFPKSSFYADTRILSLLFAVLFGFFLGLAVLAKGPAAIILTGGAVFLWALFTKRWRDAFRLLHPVGIASFCLTALPWYILCSRRNPDFFRVFIIEHNFKRYLTPEFQHIQPFWYYVPVLLVAFFPWLALLLWSLFAGSRHLFQKKQLSPATLFLLTWAAFCILFFSTSHSKLPGYILPAFPAIALLLSHSLISLAPLNRKSAAAAPGISALIMFCVAFGLPRTNVTSLNRLGNLVILLALASMIFGISNASLSVGIVFRGRKPWHSVGMILAIAPTLLLLLSTSWIVNRLQLFIVSPRYVATQLLSEEQVPLDRLTLLHIPRANRYILDFYLRRELPDWDRDPQKEAFILNDFPIRGCREIIPAMNCTNLWEEQERIDLYQLLRVVPKISTVRPSP